MRVGKLAVVVGVTACALGAGSVALAASTPQGGKIRVFVTNTSPTKGTIVITGAIGDYGTTVSQDANGKPDPNGNFEKVTLKQGGFVVNGTELNKKLNNAKPTINKANCSFSFTGTGPTTVGDGTGAYQASPGTSRSPSPSRKSRRRRPRGAARTGTAWPAMSRSRAAGP